MEEIREILERCTRERYDSEFHDRQLLHGIISKWAKERPDQPAIIDAETGELISYQSLDERTEIVALQLIEMGFNRGDFFATMLPLVPDHIVLEYACFKTGVIHVPLDMRLKAPEVVRSIQLVEAKGFATLGRTALVNFEPLVETVRQECPSIEHMVQYCPQQDAVPGAVSFEEVVGAGRKIAESGAGAPAVRQLTERIATAKPSDGAQVIYTTGSTGFPKPALLSHENITAQNMCLAAGFELNKSQRMLVNLPPSHVGCQAEQLMTTFFGGTTAVILHMFDAEKSLRAIQEYEVDCFGQIPAMFNLQYRLDEFTSFDLKSVRSVLFGGQQVSREFIRQLLAHYPRVGTGLGLSEMAGFVTYTGMTSSPDGLESTVGWWAPITPLSIREPMKDDGMAGKELPPGEAGEICFSGPQVFISYVNNAKAYRETVSLDGYCYTGDLGRITDDGLQFTGRSKLVIKPKGYQVHPGQIEDHFAELKTVVANCAAVGAPHELFTEAVMLFVEPKADAVASKDALRSQLSEHAQGIAGYMRPSHYAILAPGSFPLNRIAKTDYVKLREMALTEVERLRNDKGWDEA